MEQISANQDLFKRLVKRGKDLGLTDEQIAKLPAIKRWNRGFSWLSILLTLIVLIAASSVCLLITLYYQVLPINVENVIYRLLYNVEDPTELDCLVAGNEHVQLLFRPPVECNMCINVTEIVKVSNLTQSEFAQKYAYTGQPVVITDATKDWTAPQTFSFDYFKRLYAPKSKALKGVERECQFFPYRTNFTALGQVFQMPKKRADLQEGAPWYIGWSNCDAEAANVLRSHYSRPYFLPENVESSRTDWIFMGSPGYGAFMHIDDVDYHSWQAQLKGKKLWILEPPPECFHVCVRQMKVVVNTGETIVLNTNKWFHQTVIKGDELSITIGSEYD